MEQKNPIVAKTADALDLAEQVLKERERRNGNDDPPTLFDVHELVSVAQLVTSLGMAGFYGSQPGDDIGNKLWKQMKNTIDAAIELKLAKFRIQATTPFAPAAPAEEPIPAPPPVEPPALVTIPGSHGPSLAAGKELEIMLKERFTELGGEGRTPADIISHLVGEGFPAPMVMTLVAKMRGGGEPLPQGKVT